MPSTLNSVALINYIYFSKIAQRATHRTNYLGFVSSSYAFNHHVEGRDALTQSLSENTPLCKKAQSLLAFFRSSSSLSIREIMNDKTFYAAVFDNQKAQLIQCVRFMLEKNLIVLEDEGALTEESVFVFNDRPSVKGASIKDMRLHHVFQP